MRQHPEGTELGVAKRHAVVGPLVLYLAVYLRSGGTITDAGVCCCGGNGGADYDPGYERATPWTVADRYADAAGYFVLGFRSAGR
ncbi:hypothetical protein D3C78_1342810 [compost metagenome]